MHIYMLSNEAIMIHLTPTNTYWSQETSITKCGLGHFCGELQKVQKVEIIEVTKVQHSYKQVWLLDLQGVVGLLLRKIKIKMHSILVSCTH